MIGIVPEVIGLGLNVRHPARRVSHGLEKRCELRLGFFNVVGDISWCRDRRLSCQIRISHSLGHRKAVIREGWLLSR